MSQELALGFAKQQEHVELRPANLEQFAAEGEGLGEGGGGRIVSSADMGLGGGVHRRRPGGRRCSWLRLVTVATHEASAYCRDVQYSLPDLQSKFPPPLLFSLVEHCSTARQPCRF